MTAEETPEPRGEFISRGGSDWYRIAGYDLLDPFLITVVSPDDHWMYVSTSGALTTGRGSADRALFPYETDDRLHRAYGRVGPITVIRVVGQPGTEGDGTASIGGPAVWEPFSPHTPIGRVRRELIKSTCGDRLCFAEHHPDLGLTFSYTWTTAGRFGMVRSCRLSLDEDREPIAVELLDGLVDVFPAGVELATQQKSSTLVDAYRRSELILPAGLALFTLEALVSDQADPAESLRANLVWGHGLPGANVILSDRDVRRFRSRAELAPEPLVTGRKGAYLRSASVEVGPGQPVQWANVADVGYDQVRVAELCHWLHDTDPAARWASVVDEMDASRVRLASIVAKADGDQVTADKRATVHHVANVLFNVMRGGVFLDDHRVDLDAVRADIATRNRPMEVAFREAMDAAGLDSPVEIGELRAAVADKPDLLRLVNEHLPLTFSRRHGDPSRPWNTFHIPTRAPDGSTEIGYEGNWRDIFQNWEALLHSFPNYIESVVSKFLNASTLDGHNPYRITNRGIDWEVPEDDSWGNFGYWGDHQIVYLHRLLSAARRFHPGLLESKLGQRAYSYADIPYRIRRYQDLVVDSKNTIDFDDEHHERLLAREAEFGSDGRLVPSADGSGVHLATLAEKLLVPALAKLSNLVAGGGIWMNTQRPEWNDANNALVGNGVSVVTLFHLRDYLGFVDRLLADSSTDAAGNGGVTSVELDQAVITWMEDLEETLVQHETLGGVDGGSITPEQRRRMLDGLGRAYERYRQRAYHQGPGRAQATTVERLRAFIAAAQPHLDRAAADAGRGDGLVHTYLLLQLDDDGAHLVPLYEMLEGQVASLAGGTEPAAEVNRRLDALFASDLYRPDQKTFVLYPNRTPPPFQTKNRV
ncbi:MAG: hypothetical protein OER95_16565, partial [Acidimicrobiia bacterium]|nr:hypothetical protein [Acidimicrobiia bacterium]